MFKFERMIAWQTGVDIADEAFDVTDQLPQRLQYSVGDPLRRAALRVTNTLAEGTGRRSPGSRRNFYDVAKGSVYQAISILVIALRTNELTQPGFDKLCVVGDELASMISGLIDATDREEGARDRASRALREPSLAYEIAVLPPPHTSR
jgi:four helix bundle protein